MARLRRKAKIRSRAQIHSLDSIRLILSVQLIVVCLTSSCVASETMLAYRVEPLFTLDSSHAKVSYGTRPTPALAVDNEGNIAFPTEPYTIAVFSTDGKQIRTIIDSTDIYPKEMLFDDNGYLQVLNFDETEVIKYRGGTRTHLPLSSLEDWWRYSDTIIAAYLKRHKPDRFYQYNKGSLGSFSRFPYYIEILHSGNYLFVNGDRFEILAIPMDTIVFADRSRITSLQGIIDESLVLRVSIENYGFVRDWRNGKEIELSTSQTVINDSARTDFSGNYPETNKRNLRKNWYWPRGTHYIYEVIQYPTMFCFFKYGFAQH